MIAHVSGVLIWIGGFHLVTYMLPGRYWLGIKGESGRMPFGDQVGNLMTARIVSGGDLPGDALASFACSVALPASTIHCTT